MTTYAKIRSSAILLQPMTREQVSEDNAIFIDSENDNELVTRTNATVQTIVSAEASLFKKSMVNKSGSTIPAKTPISKLANGGIAAADSDSATRQQAIGITVSEILDDALGDVNTFGANISGAITGLGFTSGQEIYLGENGGYTNDPNSFSGDDDSLIKIGVADSEAGVASSVAKDIIIFPEIIIRP